MLCAIAIAYSCPKLLATYTKIITSLKEQKCQTVQFDLFWFFYQLRTDSVQQLVGCPIQYCLQSLIWIFFYKQIDIEGFNYATTQNGTYKMTSLICFVYIVFV